MAGISEVYADLIGKIKTDLPVFKFVHIWNNQLQQLFDGETYVFPFPNIFVEIVSPIDYKPIGLGYAQGDFIIRFHIGHEEYDAGGGNYEENTNVFALRDSLIRVMNSYQPVACSSLMKVSETQDYEHTNIYHYIVEFICSNIDSRGSLDEQKTYVMGIITDEITNAQVVPNINQ